MKKIIESLKRQKKAYSLLYSLQQIEYKTLLNKNKENLQKNQFSIQRLITQILKEKQDLKKYIKYKYKKNGLNELLERCDDKIKEYVTEVLNQIRSLEQSCMEQATLNADLAIAHLEQSKELVNFLYDNIRPKSQNFYSKHGKLNDKTEGPCVISGRL